MRIIFRFFCIALPVVLALYLASCQHTPSQRERDLAVYPEGLHGVPLVRVKIEQEIQEITLGISGPCTISAQPVDMANEILTRGEKPMTVRVTPSKMGVRIGDKNEFPYAAVTVTPLKNTQLIVGDIPFDTPVTFIRVMDNKTQRISMDVVAHMNIEEYLVGVVPSEMPSHWPMQALKAQCVAARTFALYKIQTRKDLLFDVTNTQASQVWKPANQKNALINSVVNETRGVVLTDAYRLFPAYFSSQCGGATKNGSHVFISRHINPLSEVRCPYCLGNSGVKHWQYTLTLPALTELLRTSTIVRARGYKDIGEVTGITLLDENGRTNADDARVYDVTITHNGAGKILTLSAQDFRSIVGGGIRQMASTYFTVTITDGVATFHGRGHGHGVGMCQYGAAFLAGQGKTYQEILRYYYRGCTLVRLWDGSAKNP